MNRRTLVLFVIVLGAWHARLLAVCPPNYPAGVFCECPSGNPDEIFCEDFNTYCESGGWPGGAGVPVGTKCSTDPLEPRTPAGDDRMRSVWFQTSTTESASPTLCGTSAILEDSQIQVTTPPFAGEYPGHHGEPIAQHTFRDWELSPPVTDPVENQVLNLRRFIRNKYGTQYDALTVLDDEDPLVLTFNLDSLSDGKIQYSNGFIELAYGPPTNPLNRANTDYVLHEHCFTFCDPYIDQGPFPIMCAQANPDTSSRPMPEACPPVATVQPPLHNAIAIGILAMLDTDPCHCGSTMAHGGQITHPVFFNGRTWYNIRHNNPSPPGGTITPLTPGTPATVPTTGVDAPLYHPQRIGRFVLWGNPLMAGTPTPDSPVDKPYNWLTIKIKTNSVRLELRKVLTAISNPSWKWEVYEWMDNIPLDYRGPFDTLRMGVGPGCQLESNTSWECAPGSPRTCIDCLGNQAYFADFDDFSLYGGAPFQTLGACCLSNGTCQDGLRESECAGTFRGLNTTCGPEPDNAPICMGACCNQEIACSNTTINRCSFDWLGYGTDCVTTPCPCNDPFADADGDGDVDQLDFAAFQDCFDPGVQVLGGTCKCFDVADETGVREPDNQVGKKDLARFEQCASGPGIPWNADCDALP